MTKQRKQGRPARYEGEEQQRISMKIRPRYRQALELLAEHRGIPLADAVEYFIAKGSREYLVDGKPLLDYVRPSTERINIYWKAIRYDFIHKNKARDKGQINELIQNLNDLEAKPKSLRTNFDNFYVKVFRKTELSLLAFTYFDIDKLQYAISEDWKTGYSIDETSVIFNLAIKMAVNNHIDEYDFAKSRIDKTYHPKITSFYSFVTSDTDNIDIFDSRLEKLGMIIAPPRKIEYEFSQDENKILDLLKNEANEKQNSIKILMKNNFFSTFSTPE